MHFGVLELMVIVGICLVVILPFWKIFSRAGFSGWLSFTQIVPILNVVVLFYVAFAEWPAHGALARSDSGEGNP